MLSPTVVEPAHLQAGPGTMSNVQYDITRILGACAAGELGAADELMRAVYAELRRLASAKMSIEAPGHTLQPTALVHEAWLRIGGTDQRWENRAHFFGAAAEAMRRILVERARRKRTTRHGGTQERLGIGAVEIAEQPPADELLAVHEALDDFAAFDPRKAELVKLRYFVGLTLEEAAGVLGISERTAKRDWTFAKAWLADAIRRSSGS